uniref:M1-specific T cell receptor beta chain-like isoform X2 n=1 Tax=Pristiophorus japonicus TaxID=55135 RepID=UPI00398F32F9
MLVERIILARTPGRTPLLFLKQCRGILSVLPNRQTGPRFNVSAERRHRRRWGTPSALHWECQPGFSAPLLQWDGDSQASGCRLRQEKQLLTTFKKCNCKELIGFIVGVKCSFRERNTCCHYYTAPYHCGSDTNYIFGDGTQLIVSEGEPHVSPPKLFIFTPSAKELANSGTATLLCLAMGFNPKPIRASWTARGVGRPESVTSQPVPARGEETFSVVSVLTVSAKEWESQVNFTCRLQHESNSTSAEISGGLDTARAFRGLEVAAFSFLSLILISLAYGAVVSAVICKRRVCREVDDNADAAMRVIS